MTVDNHRSETVSLLRDRASVRRFTGEPVDDELLDRLLVSATRAPTTFNFQGYSLVSVTEQSRQDLLAELTGKSFLRDGAAFVLVCADVARLWELGARHGESVGPGHDDLTLGAVVDASLVGMSLALGAESVGLGTVMIGAVRNQPREIAELFALPDGVHALFGVALGWPTEVPRARPRRVPGSVLHRERYRAPEVEPALWKPTDEVTVADRQEWADQITRGLRVTQKRSDSAAGVRLRP